MNNDRLKKILICNTEEDIRESLKLILSDHYDLILTDSGEQCLECLEHDQAIGLVLLDIKIPKVNGLETLTAIKEKKPGIKIIMVAGYKSSEAAAESAFAQTADYIVKPFKSEEILNSVRKKIG